MTILDEHQTGLLQEFLDSIKWKGSHHHHHPIRPHHPALGSVPLRMPILPLPVPAIWPTYTGIAQLIGTSPSGRVTVYVDPTLGAEGKQNAMDLLADADRLVFFSDGIFGITGGSVNVIVFAVGGATDGTGGGDHAACNFAAGGNIEVCASFSRGGGGGDSQSMRCSGLFEAEYSECAMDGNLCGSSTGEALSRWCAMMVSNNALPDFATAPTWYLDGTPNWVDQTEPTDQDPISIGCGMAFISWLRSQDYALPAIAQAMVVLGDLGTLAALYAQLTGNASADAWPAFSSAVNALPSGVITDTPFGS